MNAEKAAIVLQELAAGASLRKASRIAGIDPSTVLRWEDEDKDFAQQYAEARARGYRLLADEIIEISDDASGDVIETENGQRMDAEFVARARLRVDSRKWMLAKMLPKLYGEKVEHNIGGQVNHVHTVRREIVDPKCES